MTAPDELDDSLEQADRNAFERPKLFRKLVELLQLARQAIINLRNRTTVNETRITELVAANTALEARVRALEAAVGTTRTTK